MSIVCGYCSDEITDKRKMKQKVNFCSHDCRLKYRWASKSGDTQKKLALMISSARFRAEKYGWPFNISYNYLLNLYAQQGGKCAVTGRILSSSSTRADRIPDGISLDRIDRLKGYTTDNVRLVTYHANIAINEFGLDEFIALCKDTLSHRCELGR